MRQLGFLGEDECQTFEVFNRIRFRAASLKNGDRRDYEERERGKKGEKSCCRWRSTPAMCLGLPFP